MDPASVNPTEILELVGILGGMGVTAAAGFLLVRRARAARRRQIEGIEGSPASGSAADRRNRRERGRERESEPTPEPELEASPEQASEPAPEAGPPRGAAVQAARARVRSETPAATPEPPSEPEVERQPAQVIPFPAPPATPSPPTARRKDSAALSPGLARTRSGWVSRLRDVFAGKKSLDPSIVADIEKVLLTADIGVRTSTRLLEEIRGSLSRSELADPDAVWAFLRKRSIEMLSLPAPEIDFGSARPFVLLVIGVNGSGKTTTIGKLAAKLGGAGKRVLLAAGDTFRAAAAEQLDIWAGRSSATLVRGKEGADPSSVIFDGVRRAASEGFDVAIADTAGRLHTKTDLMQELQKVRRVVAKASPGAPHETWLVIDATSGQNAIAQAQIFTEAMAVTGIVLTKLDGTAKGGVILGIADQLKIPVRYIGVGERVEDLRPFDSEEFVDALFEPLPEATSSKGTS